MSHDKYCLPWLFRRKASFLERRRLQDQRSLQLISRLPIRLPSYTSLPSYTNSRVRSRPHESIFYIIPRKTTDIAQIQIMQKLLLSFVDKDSMRPYECRDGYKENRGLWWRLALTDDQLQILRDDPTVSVVYEILLLFRR